MTDYVEVDEARVMPGLRVVVQPSVPGPWSESAKAILFVKKLKYVKARQELLGANLPLISWSAQASSPVVVWENEPPRSTWIEQLFLFERLAPTPRLIPEKMEERSEMFGLAVEILGENGFVWNRRHLIVRDFAERPDLEEEVREKLVVFGRKYWYSDEAKAKAPLRCAEIMQMLTARLRKQRVAGSPYLVGSRLSAADIYWACAAALLRPLPEEKCSMPPLFRECYVNSDPIVNDALDPILLEHRDFIYLEHLELPMKL